MKSDFQKVYKFISRIRRKYIIKRTLDGILTAGLMFLTISSFLNLLFFFYPVTLLPLVWDFVLILTIIFIIIWFIDSIVLHKPGMIETANLVEQKGSLDHPLVSIALELKTVESQKIFTQKAYSGAAGQIKELPISIYSLKKWKIYLIVLTAVLWWLTNFTLNPVMTHYWKMPFAFLNKADAVVSPGTVCLPRNAFVKMSLEPSGTFFPSCRIKISSIKTGRESRYLILPDSSGVFSYQADSVRESFVYQFTYGGRDFNPETVLVVDPPVLYGLKMKLFPPSYTGAPQKELPDGQGDCFVYAGTKVKIEIQSDRLSDAYLIVNNDSCVMDTVDNKIAGEFTVYNPITYTFSLLDTFGQRNDSLPLFYVDIIPDDKPFVHFLKPGTNKSVNPEMVESLWLEAVDDLGLRTLKINYYKNGEQDEPPKEWNIPLKGNPKTVQKELEWNLNELSLYPGDTLFYWAQVRDSRPFKPYQIAKSDTFWYRLLSFEEIHEQVVNRENSAQKAITDVRKTQEDLDEMIKNMIKSASGEKELTWDQKQVLDKIKETIKAQADSLKTAMNSLQGNIEKLKDEGDLGEEIVEKMDQIQKALKDLIDQFGDSLFMDFDNQMITMEDMKEAVKKLEEMLPELNERLDNTLEYLEMLKRDREIAALALRAENLAQEQTEISGSDDKERNKMQQEKLLDRTKELSEDISSKAKDGLKMPSTDKLDSIQSEMESQISQKQFPSSGEMNSMSSELVSLSQSLKQMMSSARWEQIQVERKQLLDLTDDILDIAQWQEKLGKQIKTMNREYQARFQQTVNDAVKKTQQKADKLTVIPPLIKKLIRDGFGKVSEMSETILQSIGQSRGTGAMHSNAHFLYDLADLMMSIESSMGQQQAQGQCGAEGCTAGLQRLSGKQAAINSATSDLLRSMMNEKKTDGFSEAQSGNEIEQARKEAQKAQEALADELEKLAKKFGGEGESMLKRVEELEKEARHLAEMLKNPEKNITERQDRFLSRMLQAALSLHKQDEGKEERKSRVASTTFKEQKIIKPAEVVKDPDTFYLLRRKALQGNFPENYRSAIKAYFDSLEVKFLGEKR